MGDIVSNASNKQPHLDYHNLPWLRAIISLIPYVGGPLEIIFSHSAQVVAHRRVEAMFEFLKNEMEGVQEDAIRWGFLETQEWIDVVRLAVERGTRIRDHERLKAIASILKGAVTDEISTSAHAENLIDVIAALHDEQALLLREIYKEFLEGRATIEAFGSGLKDRLPPVMHGRLSFLLKRLEALGLVTELTASTWAYAGGSFELTEVGEEICHYLLSYE